MMEKFHYTLPDGHEIVLPKLENVPLGVVRKTRRLTQTDQVFTMLEELLPEAELEHVDLLDRAQFEQMFTAWKDASTVELGESSASSIS